VSAALMFDVVPYSSNEKKKTTGSLTTDMDSVD